AWIFQCIPSLKESYAIENKDCPQTLHPRMLHLKVDRTRRPLHKQILNELSCVDIKVLSPLNPTLEELKECYMVGLSSEGEISEDKGQQEDSSIKELNGEDDPTEQLEAHQYSNPMDSLAASRKYASTAGGVKNPSSTVSLRMCEIMEHPAKVTCRSRPNLIQDCISQLEGTYLKMFEASCFGHLIHLPSVTFCSNVVHNVLLRRKELSKEDNEDAMSFIIGNQEIRFGEREFAMMSGLKFQGIENKYKHRTKIPLMEAHFPGRDILKLGDVIEKFNELQNSEDKLKLGLLCIAEGVIMGRGLDSSVSKRRFLLVNNLEEFNNYPWGKLSYKVTRSSFIRASKKQDISKSKRTFGHVVYNLYGFPHIFQAWIFESIPSLKEKYTVENEVCPQTLHPRMLHLKVDRTRRPLHKQILNELSCVDINVLSPLNPTLEELKECYMAGLLSEGEVSGDKGQQEDSSVKELNGEDDAIEEREANQYSNPMESLSLSGSTTYTTTSNSFSRKQVDQQNGTIHKEVIALSDDEDQEKSAVESVVGLLNERRENLESDGYKLMEENTILNKEKSKLHGDIETLNMEKTKLGSDTELLNKQKEKLQRDFEILNKEKATVENDLRLLYKQQKILQCDFEIVNKKKTKLGNDIEILSRENSEMETGFKFLKDEKNKLCSGIVILNKKKILLGNDIKLLNSEKTKMANDIESLTDEKTKLGTDNVLLNNKKEQLQSDIDILNKKKTKVRNDINQLDKEKCGLQSGFKVLLKETTSQRNCIESMNSKRTILEKDIESLDDEKNKIGNEIELMNGEMAILASDVELFNKEKFILASEKIQLGTDIELLNKEKDSLHADIELLKEEKDTLHKALREEKDTLQTGVEFLKEEKDTLQTDVEFLKEEKGTLHKFLDEEKAEFIDSAILEVLESIHDREKTLSKNEKVVARDTQELREVQEELIKRKASQKVTRNTVIGVKKRKRGEPGDTVLSNYREK
ncbi:hypothetical protein MKW94_019750, partial [Papaver nudicaule]|nr:hypothetical protein [Papaver nudicaule]